jgi:3-oxocholest-4-en-26-oate---CoA ligase
MAGYRVRPRGFNLADLFEVVAAAVPERDAVVAGDRHWSYLDLDRRANRVANLLLSWGVRPRGRVATLLSNRVELLEVMVGAFKARATPVVLDVACPAGEARHVLDDAAAEVLVYEDCRSPVVSAVAGQVVSLRHLLVVGACRADHRASVGATKYEAALASRAAAVPGVDRSPDDLYVLYVHETHDVHDTPGDPATVTSTSSGGRPTAVTWRHEDLFFSTLGGGRSGENGNRAVGSPDELRRRLAHDDDPLVTVVATALEDADAQRAALTTLLTGGTVVLD